MHQKGLLLLLVIEFFGCIQTDNKDVDQTGRLDTLETYVRLLLNRIREMEKTVNEYAARITYLESCACAESGHKPTVSSVTESPTSRDSWTSPSITPTDEPRVAVHDCEDEQRTYRDMAAWMRDECTFCRCQNGTVKCEVDAQCVGRQVDPVVPRVCRDRGFTYQHKQQWRRDICSNCICQAGTIECTQDPNCEQGSGGEDPCHGWCLNGATCVSPPRGVSYPTCLCGRGFSGSRCGSEDDPCMVRSDPGRCAETQLRYYFDWAEKKCLPFTYTGCGGNGNNFASHDVCLSRCSVGACCQRHLDPATSTYKEICEALDLKRCRLLHRPDEGREVLAFSTGLPCDPQACQSRHCVTGVRTYDVGDRFVLACQQCHCDQGGKVTCRCQKPSVRKEIRDWTPDEVWRFQQAVRHLKQPVSGAHQPVSGAHKPGASTSVWAQLTRLYSAHIMQANHGRVFLLWNRIFLRRFEQALQIVDCSISLPYFEFATDVEALERAVIWQPNYFGGDGRQPAGCVDDHAFGDSGPCISRAFNATVGLPTIIQLATAVKTENFDDMSKMLEIFNAYYHSFIGGNMASTLAVNDPAFLLVHTYIDRLFWQWERQVNAYIPRHLHNVTILPFNVSPPDLKSPVLCVEYAMPSRGHPCNYTRNVHDWERFHGRYQGYNTLGYDRNGWTIHGRDHQGYTRDGYDTNGYDRKGLDRFGRARHDVTADVTAGRGTSRVGYQCLNQMGLRSDGYDQFGYSIHGYDVHYCNYSYHGPHAALQSFTVWETLLVQDAALLSQLPRICLRKLVPVPEVWLTETWGHHQPSLHGLGPETELRGTESDQTRSDRFCIGITSYPIVCPCRDRLVRCERNPCGPGATCPGQSRARCQIDFCAGCTAKWFVSDAEVSCDKTTSPVACLDDSGLLHPPNSVWTKSPCEECRCSQDGRMVCTRVQCPLLTCRDTTTPQGHCCPVCRGCEHEGQFYEEGSNIRSRDLCILCRCQHGKVQCDDRRLACPPVTCPAPVTPPGQCCPTCTEVCQYDGRFIRDGEHFQPRYDPCQNCTCIGTAVQCVHVTCPSVAHLACSRPQTLAGQCCPSVCNSCMMEGLEHQNGDRWRHPSSERCSTCTCREGDVQCREQACSSSCTHGHHDDRDCCATCTDCYIDGRRYIEERRFNRSSDGVCLSCTCRAGNVTCERPSCPLLKCERQLTATGQCCPSCASGCQVEGRHYEVGDRIPNTDLCLECACSTQGRVSCKARSCPRPPCTHPVTNKDTCCPVCDSCQYEGATIANGHVVRPADNRCRVCSCKDGSVTCQEERCGQQQCPHPAPNGACCPTCGDCMYQRHQYRNGQVRQMDDCRRCRCQNGTVTCRAEVCPESCTHPAPAFEGQCCPRCDSCRYDGRDYVNGRQFTPHVTDPCYICTCQRGNVTCQRDKCQLSCTHPVSDSSTVQCCPLRCDRCTYDNRTYNDGQRFRPKFDDKCTTCQCKSGNITCDLERCPQVSCRYPARPPGQCCPVCAGCEYNDVIMNNGHTFLQSPLDPCSQCSCKNGDVECEKEKCKDICTHPVPGRCCPICHNCKYGDQIAANGETFRPNTSDPCLKCQCRDGSVSCIRTCGQSCIYKGRQYQGGQIFSPDEGDRCLQCSCKDGNVQCKRQLCTISCTHPVNTPSQCCPLCNACAYGGDIIENGVTYTDRTRCQTCTCKNGNVTCGPALCDTSRCLHPVRPGPGACCPSCTDCDFNGHVIANGFGFEQDPCTTCTCRDGNVHCVSVDCLPVTCRHPITRPDQCCPVCPGEPVEARGCREESGVVHTEGERWQSQDNSCVSCYCRSGRSQCSSLSCPQTVCNRGQKMITPGGLCCAVCQDTNDRPCQHNGLTHMDKSEWPISACTRCRCDQGRVQCETDICNIPDCDVTESLDVAPGDCCPQCRQAPGTCLAYGDPHYHTFDGETLTVQGTCRYVMVKDCVGAEFSVDVQHYDRGLVGNVAWVHYLIVKLGTMTISLLAKNKVKINGAVIVLPYLDQPRVSIEEVHHTILLNLAPGVKVLWDGMGYVEVSVPGKYRSRTCGLCGNFNDNPDDELKMASDVIPQSTASDVIPQSTASDVITKSTANFGNSWKVSSPSDGRCKDAIDYNPCDAVTAKTRFLVTRKCAIIKSDKFRRCHDDVAPEPYYRTCRHDLCVCGEQTECLCTVLATYVRQCAKHGHKIQWRTPDLCAVQCPRGSGQVFDECGSWCPRTCENRHLSEEDAARICYKPCVPGCRCPAHLVQHNSRCIPEDQCPDTYPS